MFLESHYCVTRLGRGKGKNVTIVGFEFRVSPVWLVTTSCLTCLWWVRDSSINFIKKRLWAIEGKFES